MGDGFGQLLVNSAANGVVGGVMAELQDGSFGHGFLSAGASALAKPAIRAAIGIEARGMPFRVAARAAIAGTISSATGGKFLNGAVTGAFSQLFNDERTLENERAARAAQAKDHSLYLIASVKFPVGHVAIAGETPDGTVEALGFHPVEQNYEVVLGDVAGYIEDETRMLKAASSGDPDILMMRLPVTKSQHDSAIGHMRSLANIQYNLYEMNCVHAAIRSLQAAGFTNFNLRTPFGLPPRPHAVHRGLQMGLPVPSP